MRVQFLFYGIMCLLFMHCVSKEETKEYEETSFLQNSLFENISPEQSGLVFQNNVKENLYFNFLNYSYIYNGGGVAIGDVNNDGLEDVYLSSNQGTNKLFINKGELKFEDITTVAAVSDIDGWTTGVSMIDINADGWLDIYVCKSGSLNNDVERANKLYINQKDGTFKEQASIYGLASKAFSTQAYFLDYDLDGDLDVYLVNHRADFRNNVVIDTKLQNSFSAITTDQLFENIDGKFIEVTKEAGVLNKAWGLSASIGDFNDDGWPDIYVANDFLEGDFMYVNNQDGTFSNTILETFQHITANSMGSDFADINNDLKPDLVTVDMVAADHVRSKENMKSMSTENFNKVVEAGYHHQYMSNTLQLNLGNGVYSEIGQLSNIAKTDWSWAPLLADFDNDGYKDLIVTNGILHDLSNQDFRNQMKRNIVNRQKVTLEQAIQMMPSVKVQNELFKNNGGVTFTKINKDWGLRENINSNGIAYADLDKDGDLDLVINNQMDNVSLYQNNQTNNYLTIALKGTNTNPNAIGASVYVYTNGMMQSVSQYPSRGFQSSVSSNLHFGLKNNSIVDSITVRWPTRKVSKLRNVTVNQILNISIEDANTEESVESTASKQLLNATAFGVRYRHKETLFDDYNLQLLLPQKQSEKGAALSVADVNKDGLDDFFVGNAKGAAGKLYLQQKNGTFLETSEAVFRNDKDYEDSTSIFFDFDNDGDQDLYVASGSYEDVVNSDYLMDRLYVNDGKGNFTKANTLNATKSVSSVVKASDFDADGDLDLFIGGGVIPGRYPLSYPSKLWRNNDGVFEDATKNYAEDFEQLRMVNDAIFTDFNGDGTKDLIVVGEWMPVGMFANINGKFESVNTEMLSEFSGWFFTVKATDINKDGLEDYVLGNIGANNKFKPSQKKPLHIYASDFDKNSNFDVVLSKTSKQGVLLPVRGKECSSEQIPMLNQKFTSYSGFANATLKDIYGASGLSSATHFEASTFHSLVLLNNSEGGYTIQPLPDEAQFGPTTHIEEIDFDNDGTPELLGVGTLYEAEVETVRYDANKGYLMHKTDNFPTIPLNIFNGLEVRAMEKISIGNKKYLLVFSKNNMLKLLEV
ncbi:VCBS repeat-containing protein [Tenacibaculum sp. SG-28]|uniref:VCBS repeat-containing protein n=1 Tax=Tenacibaculum sp. SG-28 TaxID=754426 RepID=UPI000CF3A9C1|nr:VCBS repeat-containing protein [Tenacibaculum sp. SG-28]PQJ23169.1 RNA-binding protein [Tenacibaculum sp. SG-28]